MQITFATGVILVLGPGGVASSIVSDVDSLKYELKNIKKYADFSDIKQDLANIMEYHYISFRILDDSITATLHFKSNQDVENAKEALRNQPLPGTHSPVVSLTPISMQNLNSSSFKITITLPPTIERTEIKEMLLTFGPIKKELYICTSNYTEAIITFMYHEDAENMVNNYNSWVVERLGKRWRSREIRRIQQSFPIPLPLLGPHLDELYNHIQEAANEANIQVRITGKHRDKLLIDNKNTAKHSLETIFNIISPDTLPVSELVMSHIYKYTFQNENSWDKWQVNQRITCKHSPTRSTLSIYGLPKNRESAKKILQQIISELNTSFDSYTITCSALSEFTRIFKKIPNLEKFNISYECNRRDLVIVLTGLPLDLDWAKALLKVPAATPKVKQKPCVICYETISHNDLLAFIICGHIIHKNCLKLQIQNQVRSIPYSKIPICCVICGEPIVFDDWNKVLTNKELMEFYRASINDLLRKDLSGQYKWCENPECDYVYDSTSYTHNSTLGRKCLQCKNVYCLRCHHPIIGLSHETQCRLEEIEETDRETAVWLQENTSKCPFCAFSVEKNQGCNHMTCPRCSTHYCYLCVGEISGTEPEKHYNVPDEQCYQKYFDAST